MAISSGKGKMKSGQINR